MVLYCTVLYKLAEIAESKSINPGYIPAYASHLYPVESVFNTVKNPVRWKEAWPEAALKPSLQMKSFLREAMTKLFLSVKDRLNLCICL